MKPKIDDIVIPDSIPECDARRVCEKLERNVFASPKEFFATLDGLASKLGVDGDIQQIFNADGELNGYQINFDDSSEMVIRDNDLYINWKSSTSEEPEESIYEEPVSAEPAPEALIPAISPTLGAPKPEAFDAHRIYAAFHGQRIPKDTKDTLDAIRKTALTLRIACHIDRNNQAGRAEVLFYDDSKITIDRRGIRASPAV